MDGNDVDCGTSLCAPSPPALPLASLATLVTLSPLLAAVLALFVLLYVRVFPQLSRSPGTLSAGAAADDYTLPKSAPPGLRLAHETERTRRIVTDPGVRLVRVVFALTGALAGGVGCLLMWDIAGGGGARGRRRVVVDAGLRLVKAPLLVLVVGVIPFLLARSLVGGGTRRGGKVANRARWTAQFALWVGWLCIFWLFVPASSSHSGTRMAGAADDAKGTTKATSSSSVDGPGLVQGALARVGIVGIALMALLSGFASISTPWQTLLSRAQWRSMFPFSLFLRLGRGRATYPDPRRLRQHNVSAADLERRRAGLEAAREMLAMKRHRVAQLEMQREQQQQQREMESAAAGSSTSQSDAGRRPKLFAGVSSIVSAAGSTLTSAFGSASRADRQLESELRNLRIEISGLEAMEASLASRLASLEARRTAQEREATAFGRLLLLPGRIFAIWCVWRVVATAFTMAGRLLWRSAYAAAPLPSLSGVGGSGVPASPLVAEDETSSTPVILSLLAYVTGATSADASSTFGISPSLLLSGLVLLASASSARQTARLFSRWTPASLVSSARQNVALLMAQVGAAYAVAALVVLRDRKASGGGSSDGSASLDGAFFDFWFLLAAAATAAGIWVGRKLRHAGGDDSDSDVDDEEWVEIDAAERGSGLLESGAGQKRM